MGESRKVDASGNVEVVALTAKCSKILEVLEEGQKTAGEITGRPCGDEKGDVAKQLESSGQLSNLRRLVDTIAWGAGVLVEQLNRIQNQL